MKSPETTVAEIRKNTQPENTREYYVPSLLIFVNIQKHVHFEMLFDLEQCFVKLLL
jgi:hypothetical protein